MPTLTIHWNPYTGPCCNPDNPCDLSAKRVPRSHTWNIKDGTLKVNDYTIYALCADSDGAVGEGLGQHSGEFGGDICGFEVADVDANTPHEAAQIAEDC